MKSMKNLIIIFFSILISVSMYAQDKVVTITGNPPTRATKVEDFTTNSLMPLATKDKSIWVNSYNPKGSGTVKKVSKLPSKGKNNMLYGSVNPMAGNAQDKGMLYGSVNPKQDSINAEMMRLLRLYGKELADLHTPVIKDTTVINLSVVIKKEPCPSPMIVIDTVGLSKEKRHAWLWLIGGFGTQVAGGITFANMYIPTEIFVNARVTNNRIKLITEIDHHQDENVKAWVVLGGSFVIGGVMEYIGITKLGNVELKSNGVVIPLFVKKHKVVNPTR